MEGDDNLPVLHESEEPSAVEQLRAELDAEVAKLNDKCFRADDAGEDVEPNPSAEALGYSGARVKEVQEFEGHTYLSDGRCGPSADIGIDSENFIEDVTEWA